MEEEPSETESGGDFYSTYRLDPISDEEVLPLYAIYKRVSGGHTMEPYETLLREHPELVGEDEQAA